MLQGQHMDIEFVNLYTAVTICSNWSKMLFEAGLPGIVPQNRALCLYCRMSYYYSKYPTLNNQISQPGFSTLLQPITGVPSFVSQILFQQGISGRTYCCLWMEQGIWSNAQITTFALNSLPFISVPRFVIDRYYSKVVHLKQRTHYIKLYRVELSE